MYPRALVSALLAVLASVSSLRGAAVFRIFATPADGTCQVLIRDFPVDDPFHCTHPLYSEEDCFHYRVTCFPTPQVPRSCKVLIWGRLEEGHLPDCRINGMHFRFMQQQQCSSVKQCAFYAVDCLEGGPCPSSRWNGDCSTWGCDIVTLVAVTTWGIGGWQSWACDPLADWETRTILLGAVEICPGSAIPDGDIRLEVLQFGFGYDGGVDCPELVLKVGTSDTSYPTNVPGVIPVPLFYPCWDCDCDGFDDFSHPSGPDCNNNGVPDKCELPPCGSADDCNHNDVPDECELEYATDCNWDDILDECQLENCDPNDPNEAWCHDCNDNGILDVCDVWFGDCNSNYIPDECDLANCDPNDPNQAWCHDCNCNGRIDACDTPEELAACQIDCNNNGIPDACDIAQAPCIDCNHNTIPDECDIANCDPNDPNDGRCDRNGNLIPDECEVDCNGTTVFDYLEVPPCCTSDCKNDCNTNYIPDECDLTDCAPNEVWCRDCDGSLGLDGCQITLNPSLDCDDDGILNSCEIRDCPPADLTCKDCNNNSIPDGCEWVDCNHDNVLDRCDIMYGWSADCDHNQRPDECDLADHPADDCDGNQIPDSCEIDSGSAPDCNHNGIPDLCDINSGTSEDCDDNGIPDDCQMSYGAYDCNANGHLDQCDIGDNPSLDLNVNGLMDECETGAACCLPDGNCIDKPKSLCDVYGGRWHWNISSCGEGTCLSNVQGYVRDKYSGNRIPGASVTLTKGTESYSDWSNYDGWFSLDELTPGDWELTVTMSGFHPATQIVTIQADSSTTKNVPLEFIYTGPMPQVADVRGKYFNATMNTTYLHGISVTEDIVSTINWNGYPPATVDFIVPGGRFTVAADGRADVFRKLMDMGSELREGGVLTLVARAANGTSSIPQIANLQSAARASGISPLAEVAAEQIGSILKYKSPSISGADAMRFLEGAGNLIPGDIHLFGGEGFKLGKKFLGRMEMTADGTIIAHLGSKSWSGDNEPPDSEKDTRFAGVGLDLSASGALRWTLNRETISWIPGGYLDLGADFFVKVPPNPIRFMVWVIPCWFQGEIEAAATAHFDLIGWTDDGDMIWSADIRLDKMPEATATVGVGAEVLGVAGHLGGGALMWMHFPKEGDSALTKCQIYVKAGVTLYFFCFSHTWEQKKTWDIRTKSWQCESSEPVIEVIDRDYLTAGGGYAVFVGNSPQPRSPRVATEEYPIQTNVFRNSSPDLTASGNGLVGVWIYDDDDDPNRTPVNRTEVVFSTFSYDAGADLWSWTAPAPIAGDSTADFQPQVAALPGGDVLAVWDNVTKVLIEPGKPDDPCLAPCDAQCQGEPDPEQCAADCRITCKSAEMKSKIEIAAARFDHTVPGWGAPVQITNNSHFDFNPQIAAAGDGSAMLVWMSDPSNHDEMDPNLPTADLHYDLFDGSAWSMPGDIALGVPWVLSLSVAYEHDSEAIRAILVFAGDIDSNLATPDDRELFAIAWDGAHWGDVVRLTNDTVHDANPQVAFDVNHDPVVAWYHGGKLLSAADVLLNGQQVVVDTGATASMGAADFRLATGPAGQIAMIWQEPSQDLVDMWSAVYDSTYHVWTKPMRLTRDADPPADGAAMERAMAPAFAVNGDLVMMYNRDLLGVEDPIEIQIGDDPNELVYITNMPKTLQSDLYFMRHRIALDLAVATGEVRLSPPNPVPHETTRISAKIRNLGDVPGEDVTVAFYDGDPDVGGTLINSVLTRPGLLLGGDMDRFSTQWNPPDTGAPHMIYVVVSPTQGQVDFDLSNNKAFVSGIMKPDLVVDSLLGETAGPTDWILNVRVANKSGLLAENIAVDLVRDTEVGTWLTTLTIPGPMAPGSYEDVSWTWAGVGPIADPNGVTVYAIVNPQLTVDEFDGSNNSRWTTLHDPVEVFDCNLNGYSDATDIAHGRSSDANEDSIPDECQMEPDQLHVVGPPGSLPVGQTGTLTAVVEAAFIGLPNREVVFTRLLGSLTFTSGVVADDGTLSRAWTDDTGTAHVDFHADGPGAGLISICVTDTELPVAYSVFQIVEGGGTSGMPGDFDADGDVDGDDIRILCTVLLLPDSDRLLAEIVDMNGDGLADGRDIAPFVEAALGGN